MNTAEKLTEKVNAVNDKLNAINDKIIPNNPVKLPAIKPPSRQSQCMGAILTGSVGIGMLVGGVLLASKVGTAIGVMSLVGAGVSYLDAKKHTDRP